MVPCERTVTVAIGHGKKAARDIDAWLRATEYAAATKHEVAGFDRLHTWNYQHAPKTEQSQLELEGRQSTFAEVIGGLDEANAQLEARRCLSCGNCFECDNCLTVCAENAVVNWGPASATVSTTIPARAADCAPKSALAARSKCCRNRSKFLSRHA